MQTLYTNDYKLNRWLHLCWSFWIETAHICYDLVTKIYKIYLYYDFSQDFNGYFFLLYDNSCPDCVTIVNFFIVIYSQLGEYCLSKITLHFQCLVLSVNNNWQNSTQPFSPPSWLSTEKVGQDISILTKIAKRNKTKILDYFSNNAAKNPAIKKHFRMYFPPWKYPFW